MKTVIKVGVGQWEMIVYCLSLVAEQKYISLIFQWAVKYNAPTMLWRIVEMHFTLVYNTAQHWAPLSENSWNSKFPIVTNLVISLSWQSAYLSKDLASTSDHHKKYQIILYVKYCYLLYGATNNQVQFQMGSRGEVAEAQARHQIWQNWRRLKSRKLTG